MPTMKNLDLETAEMIALKVLHEPVEETASPSALHRCVVAAALEGIRIERERLAQWVVNDTNSMVGRGTARDLQDAIREMGCDCPTTSVVPKSESVGGKHLWADR
jgi:hypothetical protein